MTKHKQNNTQPYKCMKHRKYPIIVINILLITLVVKAYFFDPVSDTNGVFSLFVLLFLVFYNIYFVILHRMLQQKNHYVEILFYLFLLLPILLPIAILLYYSF